MRPLRLRVSEPREYRCYDTRLHAHQYPSRIPVGRPLLSTLSYDAAAQPERSGVEGRWERARVVAACGLLPLGDVGLYVRSVAEKGFV